jgi:hypothetical protein
MVIGPGFFKAVCKKLYRLSSLRSPYQKARGRSAEAANHPKCIFHLSAPFSILLNSGLDAVMKHSVCLISDSISHQWQEAATLLSMDSVRFGRALGVGARAAAKTLVTAVDAATSPNPSKANETQGKTGTETKAAVAGASVGQQAARTAAQVRQTSHGLSQGTKRFGEAAWGPFVKLSGVLWLELTGVFFGIFALSATIGAWKLHGEWRQTAGNHDAHLHFLGAVVMAAVFGYFCVSSFVKAALRGRKR